VHPEPCEALCDRDQALDLEDFAAVMASLTRR
jgi:3-deoxy-D-arabino-heptulosonate 7-phosphate (DAHP) synthase